MAKIFDRIDERQRAWIARQSMFFVGTAPRADDGHINVSPKGPIGSLRVLDDHTVAYLDIIGSGAETIAHLRENGRIVVMLCAFDGPPRILRLHGRGESVTPDDPRFADLLERADFVLPAVDASLRTVIVVSVEPDRRLVRLRRPADELRGRARALGRVGPEAAAHGRPRRRSPSTAQSRTPESIDGLPALDEDTVAAS